MLTAQPEPPQPPSAPLTRSTSLVAPAPPVASAADVASRLRAYVDRAGVDRPTGYMPHSGSTTGLQSGLQSGTGSSRMLSACRSAPGVSACTVAATGGPSLVAGQPLPRQSGSVCCATGLVTPTRHMSPAA